MLFRAFLLLAALPLGLVANTKLLRFPDIHGNRIAFVWAGDIWVTSDNGGAASRLTSHPGLEMFPKFSPDGGLIAFTGQYDGDEQVYVVPSGGGEPQRLTSYPTKGPLPSHLGSDHQVFGWTPDGLAVLFRSSRQFWTPLDSRLYTVPLTKEPPEPLEIPVAASGAISPDGHRIVYSPLYRDFDTRKRYRGGMAQDLYIFDRRTHDVRRITTSLWTERDPMWIGNSVYFSSDKNGNLNLYRYEPESSKVTQVTFFDNIDVRWPSTDGRNRIIYESGGELHVFDVSKNHSRKLSITVPSNSVQIRPKRVGIAHYIRDFDFSPNGQRAAFSARGDIITVSTTNGPVRNLTQSSNSHDRLPCWSLDGRRIAFVSDLSGEEQIHIVGHLGGESSQYTFGNRGRLYRPRWSPNSNKIAFSNQLGDIFVLDVETRETKQIVDGSGGQNTDYDWSPSSQYIAFSDRVSSNMRSIFIWDSSSALLHQVTGDLSNEFNPSWGKHGNYLYFLATREYSPVISTAERDFATARQVGIYALALQKNGFHPFPPPRGRSIGVIREADLEPTRDGPNQGNRTDQTIHVEFDGLSQRVTRVPVAPHNYSELQTSEDSIFVVQKGLNYYGRRSESNPQVKSFHLATQNFRTVCEGDSFRISLDGKHLLVSKGGLFMRVTAGLGQGVSKILETNSVVIDVIPRLEWKTVFYEAWRRYRDFFYSESMNGRSWQKIREKYAPLLRHIHHRSDLNYVIAEMIGELGVGHAHVGGGDQHRLKRPKTALLGVDFEFDTDSSRYRIGKILRGHNEEHEYRAPLTEVGVYVQEGDFILAVDGKELKGYVNPYELFRDKGSQQIELVVNKKPDRHGSRRVIVSPITGESNLRYLDWVESNRRTVFSQSQGRVGYVHLPDMGSRGLSEFIKWYYPQRRMEGLIVDVRGNGGGRISQMILERLSRKLLGIRYSRTSVDFRTYPDDVFVGPIVCLIDEKTGSDAEVFAARFRQANLGQLVGRRTKGSVIGTTSHGPLLDGGEILVPQFSTNSLDGALIIEGHGVEPDFVVENTVESQLEGRDLQLKKAVEQILRELATQ